jgi:ABC-type glycerol-3-phosphate transport system permease component
MYIRFRPRALAALRYGAALGFLAITLAPLYALVLAALTSPDELGSTPLRYLPAHPTLAVLRRLVGQSSFAREFVNSSVLAPASAALATALCLPAAYAFVRLSFPGRDVLFVSLLASAMLPNTATIIPLFGQFERLGLIDTLQGLVIVLGSVLLPTSLWLLTTYLRQIPVELEEAAQLDGAGFLMVLWRIVVPLLRPALLTIFLIDFITTWDDFFYPLIFSRTEATDTLSLGIRQVSGSWSVAAAMGLLVVAPVFALSLAFARRITAGLAAGALRG